MKTLNFYYFLFLGFCIRTGNTDAANERQPEPKVPNYGEIFMNILKIILHQPIGKPIPKDVKVPEMPPLYIDNVTGVGEGLYFGDTDVMYFYYTNRSHRVKLNTSNLHLLNNSKPTKILLHGWTEGSKTTWYQSLVSAYFKKGDFNLIGLDWVYISFDSYMVAAEKIKGIGAKIAKFIATVTRTYPQSSPEGYHLIGHSLGAHVAGHVGKSYQNLTGKKLGRITALDAAGPLFDVTLFGDGSGLNRTDALFVDAIHTDGGLFGYKSPLGTVDYYPNGGVGLQPGCDLPKSYKNFGDFLASVLCSHSVSYRLFKESINSKALSAMKCNSDKNFTKGLCKNFEKIIFGENAPQNATGSFYFFTNSGPNYQTSFRSNAVRAEEEKPLSLKGIRDKLWEILNNWSEKAGNAKTNKTLLQHATLPPTQQTQDTIQRPEDLKTIVQNKLQKDKEEFEKNIKKIEERINDNDNVINYQKESNKTKLQKYCNCTGSNKNYTRQGNVTLKTLEKCSLSKENSENVTVNSTRVNKTSNANRTKCLNKTKMVVEQKEHKCNCSLQISEKVSKSSSKNSTKNVNATSKDRCKNVRNATSAHNEVNPENNKTRRYLNKSQPLHNSSKSCTNVSLSKSNNQSSKLNNDSLVENSTNIKNTTVINNEHMVQKHNSTNKPNYANNMTNMNNIKDYSLKNNDNSSKVINETIRDSNPFLKNVSQIEVMHLNNNNNSSKNSSETIASNSTNVKNTTLINYGHKVQEDNSTMRPNYTANLTTNEGYSLKINNNYFEVINKTLKDNNPVQKNVSQLQMMHLNNNNNNTASKDGNKTFTDNSANVKNTTLIYFGHKGQEGNSTKQINYTNIMTNLTTSDSYLLKFNNYNASKVKGNSTSSGYLLDTNINSSTDSNKTLTGNSTNINNARNLSTNEGYLLENKNNDSSKVIKETLTSNSTFTTLMDGKSTNYTQIKGDALESNKNSSNLTFFTSQYLNKDSLPDGNNQSLKVTNATLTNNRTAIKDINNSEVICSSYLNCANLTLPINRTTNISNLLNVNHNSSKVNNATFIMDDNSTVTKLIDKVHNDNFTQSKIGSQTHPTRNDLNHNSTKIKINLKRNTEKHEDLRSNVTNRLNETQHHKNSYIKIKIKNKNSSTSTRYELNKFRSKNTE